MIQNRVNYQITADASQALGEFRKVGNAASAALAATGAKTIRGGTLALRQIGGALSPLGMAVAPEVTYTLSAVSHTMSGLSTAAKTAGLSLGTVVAGLAGLVLGATTAKSALDAAKAEWGLMGSLGKLKGTNEDQVARLSPLITNAARFGRLPHPEALGMINTLQGFRSDFGSGKATAAIRTIQKRLLEVTPASSYSELLGLKSDLEAQTRGGIYLKRYEVEKRFNQIFNDAFDKAQGGRFAFKPIGDAILAARDKALSDLNKPSPTGVYRPQANFLERMGFQFSGAGGMQTGDIANNTKMTVQEIRETNRILRQNNGGNFANQ